MTDTDQTGEMDPQVRAILTAGQAEFMQAAAGKFDPSAREEDMWAQAVAGTLIAGNAPQLRAAQQAAVRDWLAPAASNAPELFMRQTALVLACQQVSLQPEDVQLRLRTDPARFIDLAECCNNLGE